MGTETKMRAAEFASCTVRDAFLGTKENPGNSCFPTRRFGNDYTTYSVNLIDAFATMPLLPLLLVARVSFDKQFTRLLSRATRATRTRRGEQ